MEEQVCGTCRHYRPSAEVAGCGTCTSAELWAARPQEVLADMHACAELGSQWTPVGSSPSTTIVEEALPKSVVWLRWIGIVGVLVSPLIFVVDLFLGIPAVPEVAILWFLLALGALVISLVWGKI